MKNLHRARGEPSGWVGQGTVIRVAIVADIRLYREGLARILERQPNISVVATAATSDGSLAPLSQLAPDLILIDMAMPDSPAAIRRVAVAAPGAKVVSLSVREGEDHGDVLASAEAGAIAYVPREASLEDLVAVIECAASTTSWRSSRCTAGAKRLRVSEVVCRGTRPGRIQRCHPERRRREGSASASWPSTYSRCQRSRYSRCQSPVPASSRKSPR